MSTTSKAQQRRHQKFIDRQQELKGFVHECQLCDMGTVEGWINGELVETWDCPECHGTGLITSKQLDEQNDCIAAARHAESKVQL